MPFLVKKKLVKTNIEFSDPASPSPTLDPVLALDDSDPMEAVQEISIFPSSVKCCSVRVMLREDSELYSPVLASSNIGSSSTFSRETCQTEPHLHLNHSNLDKSFAITLKVLFCFTNLLQRIKIWVLLLLILKFYLILLYKYIHFYQIG